MSDKDAIMAKIKKCLALSKSSNEHEAATALRQAQKLMEAHGVTDFDIEVAEISETPARSGSQVKPAKWENQLAEAVSATFGCDLIFLRGAGRWLFIGATPAPQIAGYAFEVLLRQAKRARTMHIKSALKRCGLVNRTRRADLFSEGWVRSATAALAAFANTEAQKAAIAGYIAAKYLTIPLAPRDRNAGRSISNRDFGDWVSGRNAGKHVTIHRGMPGQAAPLALELQ